jgi:hypothetical protein
LAMLVKRLRLSVDGCRDKWSEEMAESSVDEQSSPRL